MQSISPGYVKTEIGEAAAKASNLKLEDLIDDRMKELMSTLPGLESKDIADGVIYTLSTPPHVQVHEIIIKPVGEPF